MGDATAMRGDSTHGRISAISSDWGDAQLSDIDSLLADTASHLNRLLRTPFNEVVVVKPAPANNGVPRTLFRSSPADPFVVQTHRPRQEMGSVCIPVRTRVLSYPVRLRTSEREPEQLVSRDHMRNKHPCSLFGVWQSDGPPTRHTLIGLIMQSHWRATPRNVYRVKSINCLSG